MLEVILGVQNILGKGDADKQINCQSSFFIHLGYGDKKTLCFAFPTSDSCDFCMRKNSIRDRATERSRNQKEAQVLGEVLGPKGQWQLSDGVLNGG